MKTFTLFTILCFIIFSCYAGEYTKVYITNSGDTITKKSKIKINKVTSNIYPNFTYEDGEMKINAAKRFLNNYMAGNVYSIRRMTRLEVKNKKEYKQIIVLFIEDRLIHPIEGQAYWINIEEALKEGSISIINNNKIVSSVIDNQNDQLNSSPTSKADELKKLFELKQSGALTEEEYQREKEKLLK